MLAKLKEKAKMKKRMMMPTKANQNKVKERAASKKTTSPKSKSPSTSPKNKGKGAWRPETKEKMMKLFNKNYRPVNDTVYIPGQIKFNALGKIISEKPSKPKVIKYIQTNQLLKVTKPINVEEAFALLPKRRMRKSKSKK